MDDPKTRREKKGNKKDKDCKGVYNQKHIRLQESLQEKRTKIKNIKDNESK